MDYWQKRRWWSDRKRKIHLWIWSVHVVILQRTATKCAKCINTCKTLYCPIVSLVRGTRKSLISRPVCTRLVGLFGRLEDIVVGWLSTAGKKNINVETTQQTIHYPSHASSVVRICCRHSRWPITQWPADNIRFLHSPVVITYGAPEVVIFYLYSPLGYQGPAAKSYIQRLWKENGKKYVWHWSTLSVLESNRLHSRSVFYILCLWMNKRRRFIRVAGAAKSMLLNLSLLW